MSTQEQAEDPSEAFAGSLKIAMRLAADRLKPKTIYDWVASDPKIIVKSNGGADIPFVAHDDSVLLIGPIYCCEKFPEYYWAVAAIQLLRDKGYTGYIYLAYDLDQDVGGCSGTTNRSWNFSAARAAKKVLFWHPEFFNPSPEYRYGILHMNSLVELLADCAKVVCLDHLSKKLFIGSDSKEVLASDIFGLVYMFNAGLNRLPSTKLEDLVDLVIKS